MLTKYNMITTESTQLAKTKTLHISPLCDGARHKQWDKRRKERKKDEKSKGDWLWQYAY